MVSPRTIAPLLALALTACPVRPRDETTDDGAQETTGKSTADPDPASAETGEAKPEPKI